MLFVLNRDFQILGLASNDSEDTLHYYQDTLHTELVSGVSTYEFTVPKNHEDSQHIQEGNYVTFQNSKGKQLLFTIMEMEEDGQEKVVYCEDIGLDLLNETNAPLISDTAKPVAWYVEQALYDSGWEIGVNEIAHLSRALNFDSYTNALERILSILKAFDDAEVDFTVEFDGNAVTHQYLNIHKRVGRDTGIRLNAGFELLEARRTVSMESLVTSLRGIGKDIQNENPDLPDTTTDFSAIVYDDGRYYSKAGSVFVMDREANLKWSRFRNQQAQWDGYIVDIYDYDTDSPQELFNRTLSQLKKRNEPAITYEIAVNKIDADLSIGDTVTVVDSEFNPALYLQARVLSVNESDTDDSKNSIKLGNYVLLKSSIDAQLKELQATLKEVRLSWFEQNQPTLAVRSTNGEAFFDNAINTTINATITRGGIDTNSAYQESDFVWTKKDRLGNTVSGWSRIGKALAVTAADVIGKSIFICTVGGMSEQVTIFNTETTIKATTAPSSPVQGQLWLNTGVTPPRLNIYLSGVWKKVEGETGPQGAQGLQGLQGSTGSQGIQGVVGPNGVSSYTHIAYATSSTGSTGFSTSVSTAKTYVGMYVDSNPTDSEVATSYNWTLIKGADGSQGIQGPTGASGQTSYLHIAYATNATGSTGFSTTDSVGKTYIGQYTDFVSADSTTASAYAWTLIKGEKGDTGSQGLQGLQGSTGSQGIQGPIGANGVSSYTHIAYATSSTGSTGFSTSVSTGATYIGMYVDSNPTDSETPSAYNWTLIKGADGSQGIQGPTGANGQTSYLHIAYATNSTGTTGFSTTDSVGKTYIGQYTDFTSTDSTNPALYSWTLIKGETGAKGATGAQGPQGATGTSVSGVVEYYLATSSASGVTTAAAGWTTTIQTMTTTNKYLWNYEKINFSDGNSQDTLPVIIGAYGNTGATGSTGATGRSIVSIVEHYLATASATGVTRATSGWTTTMQTTTGSLKYLWNYETITWSSGTITTYVEPIIIGVHGATGSQGPTGLQGLQGATGSQGIQGPAGTSSYTHIAYSTSSTGSTGFSTSVSVNKTYIGMYIDSSPTDSETPSSYNWTLIKGADGSQGIQGPTGANGQTSYLHIAYATNATGSTGFSATDSVGKTHIGQYTDFTSTDSTNPALYNWTLIKGETGAQGIQGPTGSTGSQGVQGPMGATGATLYTWVKYADTPTTGMNDSPTGKTYMGLAYNKATATESSVYTDYSWSLIKGATGATGGTGSQGIQGPIGPTGATLYTWIKYADTPTTGMADLPTDKKYLGLAYNKSTATESSTYSDYSWSLMYEDVEIGGRNLWINHLATGYSAIESLGANHITGQTECFRLDNGGTLDFSIEPDYSPRLYRKLTFSAWVKYTDVVQGANSWNKFNIFKHALSRKNSTTQATTATDYITLGGRTGTSDWVKITYTYDYSGNTSYDMLKTSLRFNLEGTTSGTAWVTGIKVEYGNIATDYSKAPEDVEAVVLGIESRVTTTESAVTADAITNTVMGTTTFNAKLAEYAKGEELAGYATTGALEGVRDTAQSAVDSLNNLDLTPYVKTTQMEQLEDSITTKISQSGGVNLLRNSIGWNGIDFWTNISGATETIQTPQLETFGYGAGFYKRHAAASSRINQTVKLPMAGTYTLSFRMNKSIETTIAGKYSACGIYIDNLPFFGEGTGSGLTNGFEEFSYTFTTTKLTADISVVIGELAEATISGLMLNLGTEPLQWTSHSTEVYNTNVRMDINGIQVMGNRDGSKTVITPDEFSGYEDGEKVFTLNGDTTEVKKLKAEQQFEMAPITIVTIDNASYKGWAFI